uniref:Essential for reactive oxygen species protein n=1 Tax=Varanus komodoensis TaxID=61221 RepID=A0A8D2KRG3_VARKO
MYMLVENHSDTVLHLKRSPGIRSWSLLVGISSVGLAAGYYSDDSWGWKFFYLVGCLFVAVQNLEDWEEAIFQKDAGKVILKSFNLYKKLLTLSKAGHEQVVVPLDEIRAVNVEEEKVRYFGKGYLVVLRFGTGFSHPLTQSAVMGCRRYSLNFLVCGYSRVCEEASFSPRWTTLEVPTIWPPLCIDQ